MARVRNKPVGETTGEAESGAPIEQCLLIQDEIWRIVAEAARSESRLSVSNQARRIASAFPAAGLPLANIIDALVFAAVDAGVVLVETQRPAQRQVPAINVPGLIAFVKGGRRARAGHEERPDFRGVAIPAT